ncbi:MAG TPA: hypothetical protein VJ720_10015, partial [Chitinophaga sp.]|nr:hypothetical protein [Chitinophaga sp.]
MPEDLQKSLRLPPFLWNILLGCAALLAGLIIKYLLAVFLKFTARKVTNYSLVRSIVFRLGKPINYFLPLLLFNMALPLMELPPRSLNILSRATEIGLIITFGFTLTGLVKVFEDYMYHQYDLKKEDNLRERKLRTQLQFVRKLAVSTIMVLTLCAVLL